MERRRTILIVDDVAMLRELGALFLARTGRVLTAAGGREGLELARRERPDVVLVDLHMPGMDGEAFCRAVKADPQLAGTPVVVLNSSELAEDRARALRAGADDVLAKPLNRVALSEAVQRFLRPDLRSLPRVPFREWVHIRDAREEGWGVGENLSRGGMFVEAGSLPPPRSEIALEFALPDGEQHIASTAEVVWHRPGGQARAAGMGLRFLGMDAPSARRLEDYVYEHRLPGAPPPRPRS